MHRLASMTSSGLGVVRYGYDTYGKLESIELGEYDNGNNWVLHNRYSLIYDAWNRPVQTKVGTTALSTNTYDDDFRLSTVTYANGLSAHSVYDKLGRVEKIYQTEGNNTEELTYEMIYNGEGDLYEIRNYRTGRASFFDYDHAGRCMASKEREMDVDDNTGEVIGYGAILSSYGYQYDACNNLTKLTCSVLGSSWSTIYTYDDDNRPSTTTLASGKVISNTYDAIGRLTNRAIGLSTTYNTTLTYVPGNATNKTTGLVSTYQNGSDDAYSYTYDDVGNITSITQGSTSISYEYDAANRLIRENNQVTNQTITYEYDTWGNILNKKIYAYTTGTLGTPSSTVNYAYTNSAWGDQLTSYNGQTITYDSMGNPTTYRGYTMTWRGKQLAGFTDGTKTVSFEYNEDGLRQQKTYNDVVTDYYYNGSVLIGMQRGTAKERFSYDAAGNVVSVNHNGTEYYYLRNAQGDIVKIIDGSGTTVVEYTYDTWGKKVQTTGSLAGSLGLIQPFRYRGYVYDWETGFYYLQSRYYDPSTGRFISADVLLSTGQGVLGHNCYAYCNDNPVRFKDICGCEPEEGDQDEDWWKYLLLFVICPPLALMGCSPSSTESEPYSNQANCYAYALKLENDPRTNKPFKEKPQPGEFSGNKLDISDFYDEDESVDVKIIRKVTDDAKVLNLTFTPVDSANHITKSGNWLVALAYDVEGYPPDYHWYRRNDDGTWSHKPGSKAIEYTDANGNIITDPATCKRGRYSTFVGYFEVGPN